MSTITETIPSLGSVPTTADPATFDARADTLLGTALPAFRDAVNVWAGQANTVAGEVNANAVAVAANAVLAEAAADAAVAAAGAELWVSGQAYSEGDAAISPTDLQTYRANTTTSGTTDPSASGDWTLLGAKLAITRIARTSNTIITSANNSNLIDITSGTFTQTFDPAATLGNGFFVYLKNSGTGIVTLDPNASETINGAANFALNPGAQVVIQSDGTNLYTVIDNGASTVLLSTIVASAASTVDVETGFSSLYDDYIIVGSGLTFSAEAQLVQRWKIGGAYITSSTYYRGAVPGSQSTTAVDSVLTITNINAGSFVGQYFSCNASAIKTAIIDSSGYATTPMAIRDTIGAANSTSGVLSGVRLYTAGGQTITGTFKLYGVKK
jgi:hypothetical protein